ncbi:pilus assembly protein TadG-related protein, partial [Paraburkholderia sp. SIMBA_049]
MSPRLQFRGPARQPGAIGLMAALTMAAALLCLVVVVDTGRLYLEKRNLQRVADMAALEAATRGGDCLVGASAVTYATASAHRKG